MINQLTNTERIRQLRKARHNPYQKSDRPLRAIRQKKIDEEIRHQERTMKRVHTVGAEIFKTLVQHNTKVRAREAYRLALHYLLIDRDFVDGQGYVLVPDYKVAAWCKAEGGIEQYASGNFNTGAFLRALTIDVLPDLLTNDYHGPDRGLRGQCRYVVNDGLGDLVKHAIFDFDETERYDLLSMVRWNRKNAKANRDRLIEEARVQRWPYPQQKRVADYLHTLPFGLFAKQIPERIAEAREYVKHDTHMDDLEKTRQYRILRRIEDNPQPVYRPGQSMRNARLFAFDSLCDVERHVRRILCRGWHEVDAVNCFPAIAARVWHIEQLQTIIDRGDDVWNVIASELGIPRSEWDAMRDAVKEAGCRLLCGGRIDKTNENVLWKHGVPGMVKDSLTLMSIVRAVQRVKRHVRAEGGTQTPMGWIALTCPKDDVVRSHLSNVLAAYELALLAPCQEVAAQSQDFTITIWQHDGFSIKLRWEDRARNVLDRLNDAIAPVARLYGINTRLEYKT